MDLNGKSDPFMTLSIGKKEFKTKTIKKTLNPNWNESFEWKLDSHLDDLLYVNVYDWDMLSKNGKIEKFYFLTFLFLFRLNWKMCCYYVIFKSWYK